MIGKPPFKVADFHPRILFSTEKFHFYSWPPLVESNLFSKLTGSNYKNYWSYAGYVKRKVNFGELYVEIALLGLPHIAKAASETWPKPCVKVNAALARYFQRKPCWEIDVIPNVNFVLSNSNNKDQLGDLYNYLN